MGPAAVCYIRIFGPALSLAYLNSGVFTDGVWLPTVGWVELTGQGSSEVKLAEGEVTRGERREYRE